MKKILKYLLVSLLAIIVLLNIITAFHAYKFTHFYETGKVADPGKAKRSGWDLTNEILFGRKVARRANTLVPDSSFETVSLTSAAGLTIEGWHQRTMQPAKGTVLLFHGHGSTKSAIANEAAAFRKLGYHTFSIDFRAHGNSGGNTCTIGYCEAEEVQLAYHYIQSTGETNIVLWGISMGAAAITRALHVYPLQPDKVILEMPYGSLAEAAAGRIKLMHLPPQPLATMVTFWGGVQQGFWAFNMQPAEYAKTIRVPTLLQWGRLDPRVSEAETRMIFANLPGVKKLAIYENSAHESLYKNETTKWLSSVDSFLYH